MTGWGCLGLGWDELGNGSGPWVPACAGMTGLGSGLMGGCSLRALFWGSGLRRNDGCGWLVMSVSPSPPLVVAGRALELSEEKLLEFLHV